MRYLSSEAVGAGGISRRRGQRPFFRQDLWRRNPTQPQRRHPIKPSITLGQVGGQTVMEVVSDAPTAPFDVTFHSKAEKGVDCRVVLLHHSNIFSVSHSGVES